MGVVSFCVKFTALSVALFAVFVGLALNGALKPVAVFMDSYDFFKGMFPAMHADVAWGFTLEEMPNLTGDTILVTGGNVGLGYWTARHLAASKATVIIGCRSQSKCDVAAASIEKDTGVAVETVVLDLGSFASIRSCAAALAKHPSIDSLILNAGVMVPPFSLTEDGLERQIGVNHFGHFLLTKLLMPQVEAAAASKGVATIVPVSSAAHYDSYPEGIRASLAEMNDEATYDRGQAYGQSKLANVLFAQELAKKMKDKNILVNSIHPGGVDTDLGRHVQDMIALASRGAADQFKTAVANFAWHPREAALTQLYAAVGPALKEKKTTGKYFHPIARESTPDPHALGERGAKLGADLWRLTEDFISKH